MKESEREGLAEKAGAASDDVPRPGASSPAAAGAVSSASEASAVARALGLTMLILVACVAYGAVSFPLVFNTNDDAAMLGISLGLFSDGLGDPRLVYQSAFLGALLGGLFRLAPGFDWYSACQWFICLGAFAAIGFSLLRRERNPLAIALFAAVCSIYLAPLLFQLQFTQTSFACVAASFVLALDALCRERVGRAALALALAFAVLAALVRSINLVTVQVLCAVLIAAVGAWGYSRGERRRVWGRMGVGLGLGVSATLLVVLLQAAEAALFYADPGWSDFWQHHADRAFVLDNAPTRIGFMRVATALESELGITPHQLLAMLHWLPIDASLYSLDGFGRMAHVIRELEASSPAGASRLAEWLPQMREFIGSNPIFTHSLGLIAVIAVLRAVQRPESAWKSLVIGVLWIGVAVGLVAGISLQFRFPPYRVWMPLAMVCVLASLACHAVVAGGEVGRDEGMPTAWRRHAALVFVGLVGLGGLAPLHRDFRIHLAELARVSGRMCAMSDAHVLALEYLPEGARAFIAPRVVHSECYLKPFELAYPEVLERRSVAFGWRNLTPWVREDLFAESHDLFDVICADPRNMFVLHPADWQDIESYLRRHEPGTVFQVYSKALPPAILSCQRGVDPDSSERVIGARPVSPDRLADATGVLPSRDVPPSD